MTSTQATSQTITKRALRIGQVVVILAIVSCSGRILKVDQENERALVNIEEYDRALRVKEIPPAIVPPGPHEVASSPLPKTAIKGAKGGKFASSKSVETKTPKGQKQTLKQPTKELPKEVKPCDRKEPMIEDAEGFLCRRPKVDPFRVGESTSLKLTYFGIRAGDMNLDVKPFVEVNGKKAYHFSFAASSNESFSSFYSVKDSGETFVDFETLLPYNYALHVKESKQLREVRSYVDWAQNLVKFWIRKVSSSDNVVEKLEKSWEPLPFTQNSFSAVYYMRTFQLRPGKVIQYHVHDEEKNMLLKAEVLRTEKLETALGVFDTVVIRPEIEIGGVFKPMGEILFWLTNDDRKFLVQFSSKIKIGSVMGYLTSIQKGIETSVAPESALPGATQGSPSENTTTTAPLTRGEGR